MFAITEPRVAVRAAGGARGSLSDQRASTTSRGIKPGLIFSFSLSFRWKMSNIWFPVPVATLFRRLVNVISTASIAHHYLLPSRSLALSDDHPEHELDPRSACRVLWENGPQDAGPLPRSTGADGLEGFLNGTYACPTPTIFYSPVIASGRLSIPWPRWPARFSLSRSAQQLAEPPRTDEDGRSSALISDPNPYPPSPPSTEHENRGAAIHRLMQSPVLYDPLRAPRFPIVLCHGAPPQPIIHPSCQLLNDRRRVIRLRRPRTPKPSHAVLVNHSRHTS